MKGTILIATMSRCSTYSARNTLRDLGWRRHIREAPDGKTAIALANKKRPELIFSSHIVMPARLLGGS